MARWRDAISREQAALTKLAEAEAQLKLEREIASREIASREFRAAGGAGAITTAALTPSTMPAPPAPPAPPLRPADELLAAAAATTAAAAAAIAVAKAAAAAKEATAAAAAAAAVDSSATALTPSLLPPPPLATASTAVPSMVFDDVGHFGNFQSPPPAAPPATTTLGAEGFPDLGDGFVSFVSAPPAHSSSVSLVSAAAGDEPALPPPSAPFDQLAWAAVPPAALPTEDEQLSWALRESNRMAAETAPPPPSPWPVAPGTALSKANFESNGYDSADDEEDEDEDEDEDYAGPADEGLTREETRLALVQFYREFNPTKLHEIETILNRYEGSYTAMFARLRVKYQHAADEGRAQPPPPPPPSTRQRPASEAGAPSAEPASSKALPAPLHAAKEQLGGKLSSLFGECFLIASDCA